MHTRMHACAHTHTNNKKQEKLNVSAVERERERDGQVFSRLDFNILSTTQHQVRTER